MGVEQAGGMRPEQQKLYEYRGVEIPSEFVGLFTTCLSAFQTLESHFNITLDEMILEGFADEVAKCADTDDVRGVFMQHFNEVISQYDLDARGIDAEEVLVALVCLSRKID